MKTNLNSRCEFVLTEMGARIWNDQYSVNIPPEYRPEPKKAGDTVRTQLWTVIQVFGPYVHMGMVGVPFEGNNMDITPC